MKVHESVVVFTTRCPLAHKVLDPNKSPGAAKQEQILFKVTPTGSSIWKKVLKVSFKVFHKGGILNRYLQTSSTQTSQSFSVIFHQMLHKVYAPLLIFAWTGCLVCLQYHDLRCKLPEDKRKSVGKRK